MEIREALHIGTLDPLDRSLLLAAAIRKERTFVLSHPEYILTPEECDRFRHFVERRERHEPLAYIVGEKEFFGRTFLVNKHTLIPRPETELMVEQVLKMLDDRRSTIEKEKKKESGNNHQFSNIDHRIALIDIGTGSGCIIISIAKSFETTCSMFHVPCFMFFATDISNEALAIAQKNAERHGVNQCITLVQSDLLQSMQEELSEFDELYVLANLPYVSDSLFAATETTVRQFEPKSALVSGPLGLDHYERLLAEMASLPSGKNITFWLEISPEQAPLIEPLLKKYGAQLMAITNDLADKPRLVCGTLSPR